jgi:hypothetical protein
MAWAMAIPAIMSQVGGMAGQASTNAAAADQARQARGILDGMTDLDLVSGIPDYSFLDYAGDYNPYAYATPESAQYKTVEEDPRLREIEMAALQKLVEQASGAADAKNAAARYGALDDANQLAKAREGAIRNQMERKGQGGAGLNALMQAQSAQMGANRARAGTMDAVSQAALEKLAAMQGAVGAAGQVRGQDFNVNRYNSDTINDFNKFNTAARNRVNQMNTEGMNSAQLRNLNTRQDIMGRNTGIANSNVDRKTQNRIAMNTARNNRLSSQANATMGHANMLQQQAPQWGQMGQQGAQMFTNIGSGLAAYENANKGNKQNDDDGEWL